MNELLCHIDGRTVPQSQAGLPLDDLGLQRGYAVFDFLRVVDGIPLFLEDHLARLLRSAEKMRLPMPVGHAALGETVRSLLSLNGMPSCGMRIIVTGGPSPDGYRIAAPRLVVLPQPLAALPDALPARGFRLRTYEYRRQIPDVKTTDYLMAVWLQPWLVERGGDDILYHEGGLVSECPRSNIFLVTGRGRLQTPRSGMLPGVTRLQVLRLAERLGLQAEERDVTLSDLAQAAEVFLTASTKRLAPVSEVDGHRFPAPGPVTQRLWDAFLQVEREYTGRRKP